MVITQARRKHAEGRHSQVLDLRMGVLEQLQHALHRLVLLPTATQL